MNISKELHRVVHPTVGIEQRERVEQREREEQLEQRTFDNLNQVKMMLN